MFADDTTINAVGKSKTDITQTLQNEICHIENWCQQNSLLPNAQTNKNYIPVCFIANKSSIRSDQNTITKS